jgi:hypothetical protein
MALHILDSSSFHPLHVHKRDIQKIILKYRAKTNRELLPPGPSGFAALKFIMGAVLFRPIHMLLTEPIVISFAVYISFN